MCSEIYIHVYFIYVKKLSSKHIVDVYKILTSLYLNIYININISFI